MLLPSFVELGLPVPEKIFEGFLPYMGMVAIIMSSDFHFLVPKSFLTQFGLDRHSSF